MPRIKTPVELGAVIRDARERHSWTQTDLAQRANVTRQWVIRMEKGRHDKAEVGLVLAVLNALEVSLHVGEILESAERPAGPIDGAPVDLDAVITRAMGG